MSAPAAPTVAVPLDDRPGSAQLITELANAKRAMADAVVRYRDAEERLRAELGEPDRGARVATYRGDTIARWSTHEERRLNTTALRESWPEIAEAVTETRLRTRLTVELAGGAG